MRPQQQLIDVEKERVLHVAGGMVGREVERLEVVPVRFHFRTGIERVAHLDEDLLQLAANQRGRMEVAKARSAAGEGDVEWTLDFLSGEKSSLLFERLFRPVAELIQCVADFAFLFLGNFFQPREKSRDQSGLTAEVM